MHAMQQLALSTSEEREADTRNDRLALRRSIESFDWLGVFGKPH